MLSIDGSFDPRDAGVIHQRHRSSNSVFVMISYLFLVLRRILPRGTGPAIFHMPMEAPPRWVSLMSNDVTKGMQSLS